MEKDKCKTPILSRLKWQMEWKEYVGTVPAIGKIH